MKVDTETGTQRSRQQTAPSSSTHQCKRIQFQLDASCRRSFVYHDVDAVVFHRRIQVFFHHRTQTMDFINEKDIVRLETGQHTRQVTRLVKHRTGGHLKAYSQFIRYNVTQCGLTQTRRAVKQHMVKRLATQTGRFHEDA